MSISAPYLPPQKLRELADEFLKKRHPSGEVPVPIERIVEFGFEIDIVPTPGLHDQFEIDSYITSDLSAIHVDDGVYKRSQPVTASVWVTKLPTSSCIRAFFSNCSFRALPRGRPQSKQFRPKTTRGLSGKRTVSPDSFSFPPSH